MVSQPVMTDMLNNSEQHQSGNLWTPLTDTKTEPLRGPIVVRSPHCVRSLTNDCWESTPTPQCSTQVQIAHVWNPLEYHANDLTVASSMFVGFRTQACQACQQCQWVCIYIYIYIYIYYHIYIYTHTPMRAHGGQVGGRAGTQARINARLGWHYWSNTTCVMRPHLFSTASLV